MQIPPRRELAVLAVRRALGIALALQLFYLLAPYLWPMAPLTAGSVLAIIGVAFLGVGLGVAFSYAAPLPTKKGLPRVIRTALLTVPAMGIGIAIQLFIAGPEGERAYHVMFALAAWLGSGFIREDPEDEREETDGSGETGASEETTAARTAET